MNSGVIIWISGSKQAGMKVGEVARALCSKYFYSADIIDEDVVREKLCSGEVQADANIRALTVDRTHYLAYLLERNGCGCVVICNCATRKERDEIRKKVTAMIEVYVRGQIPEGYEPPYYPDVEIEQDDGDELIADKILKALIRIGVVATGGSTDGYSSEEEQVVKDRLEKLGYL